MADKLPENESTAEREAEAKSGKAAKASVEDQRSAILGAVAGASLDTMQRRVAWILNNYPDARDSDITLQLRYWELFEDFDGESITRDDLYRLSRLTSLSRARAHIQNKLKLFVASPEVAQHRGTLDESERDKARAHAAHYPVFAVYADESGKTGTHLIVGSVWFANGPETAEIAQRVLAWRKAKGFQAEIHFKEIGPGNVDRYIEFIELFLEYASSVSFKAITASRPGLRSNEDAFRDLYVHLLIRGVEHEDKEGRARLPRALQLWKDLEEKSRDDLLLANIRERLDAASQAKFEGKLYIDDLISVDSASSALVQMADLFASSINRVLNNPESERPKDRVARYLLGKLGIPNGPAAKESEGDMAVLISL